MHNQAKDPAESPQGQAAYPVSLTYWLPCSGITIPHLYIVGGTVRDLLLGGQPKDIDLVCRGAKDLAYHLGRCRRAAVVPMEKKASEPCYRVVDRGHPDNYLDIAEMRGQDIMEDLAKRDFTINALALQINENGTCGPLLDPCLGAADLRQRTIRMTGEEAFVSDPLRILRAIRLSATLGFGIDPQTRDAMRDNALLLATMSGERIWAELLLILKSFEGISFVREMDQLSVLEVLFPEISAMKGCRQDGYHHKDVWEHSLLAAENCEGVLNDLPGYFGAWAGEISANLSMRNRGQILKLASLLHDVGKPRTRGTNPETGRTTFYGHAKAGSALVEAIAGRMKLSSDDREFLLRLVAGHLMPLGLAGNATRVKTRLRWFRRLQDDVAPALILGIADVKSSLGSASTAKWRDSFIEWSIRSVIEYYETARQSICSPSLINGRDLITLGMTPGPQMGRLLLILRDAQDAREISTPDEALAMAKGLVAKETR